MLNRPMVFEVNGTGLDDNVQFELAGCAGIVKMPGGTSSRRTFSCTPSGNVSGSSAMQVYSSVTGSKVVSDIMIDFVTPVAKLGEINGALAVLKSNGALWVWANDAATSTAGTPVVTRTLLGLDYADLATGNGFGLVVGLDGNLWAWGANSSGVYGNGSTSWASEPVHVGTGFSKVAVKGNLSVGGDRVVGLKRDGSLWAWGGRSSPVPNSPDIAYLAHQFASGFSDLSLGSTGESMALQADGSLWSWSENLSDTPFVTKKIGDGYQSVVTIYDANYGIKKNGELWAWGAMVPASAPAGGAYLPVKLGQDYALLAAGAYHVMALKTDGTLWGYGRNSEGQLGKDPAVAAPGQGIEVASGVRNVWASDSCTIIEKRDGTLWGTAFCRLGAPPGLPTHGFRQLPQF